MEEKKKRKISPEILAERKAARDLKERKLAVWRGSPVICPRCKSKTKVLTTPVRGKVLSIECTECSWQQ